MADTTMALAQTTNKLYLTTSWDDGDPMDTRIAELLSKHDIPGTFYVPCNNREGREVISSFALRDLSQQFEIGSHTLDHYPVDGKDLEEIRHQIVDGKQELENQLGKTVDVFCYPGGRNHAQSRKIVREAGFKCARTTADFNLDIGRNPYLIPTTAQFKVRRPASFAFNYLKWGHYLHRAPMLAVAITHRTLESQLDAMLNSALRRGGVFHLWGHSYQIEELGLWNELEKFLFRLAEYVPQEDRLNNGKLFTKSTLSPENNILYENEANVVLRGHQ